MKTTFKNIKAKMKEFFKTDKAKIGGACVCALLICVGVGFGVNAIASQNAQNLPSKALENTVSENTKTEGENTEKSTENGESNTSEGADEVTVNDKGEVVDSSGNVVAESVEQYNATQNSQTRPVATSNPSSSNNNTSQAQPSGSTQPAHTHSWATRCIQEAYDEMGTREVPVRSIVVCNGCGARDIDGNHTEQHMLKNEKSSTHTEVIYQNEQYVKRHHNAVYQEYCTTCGTTR